MELRKGKDEKEKGKEKVEKGREEKKKPGFAAKAVLAAGVMLAAATGCTERVTNNYNCPDSRTEDTVEDVQEEPDAPEALPDIVEDTPEDIVEEEGECIADRTPLTCDSREPVAEGVMSLDEPLEAGNISFELRGTEENLTTGEVRAIIAVVDECGETLSMDTVYEGQTKEFSIEGATYHVTVNVVHLSEDNPWADASISITCEGDFCLVVGGIINQGEMMLFDAYRLRLDDLDTTNPEEPAVVVSILDSADYVLRMLRIPKGEKEYFMGYKIDVLEVAPGYTFGSKWAEIDISKRCEE